jgi:hypothetical protein
MSTLTIRLPEDAHERLETLAEPSSVTVNQPVLRPGKVTPVSHGARIRFETPAASGKPQRAREVPARPSTRSRTCWNRSPIATHGAEVQTALFR